MARALITGSNGFVGRHFTLHLLKEGWDVVGVDNLASGLGGVPTKSWLPKNLSTQFTFFEQDCRLWFSENRKQSFDLVIHLAAVVGGRESIENQPLQVATDLSIDSEFLNWVASSEQKQIIAFSSSAAYPVGLQTNKSPRLLREADLTFAEHIGVPDMSYGWSKLTLEFLCSVMEERYGTRVAIYRPFSGYGGDQATHYPFPAILKRALAREVDENGNFVVWGTGQQIRDFIHIDDVVHAVMTTYSKLTAHQPINLSTGIGTSFIELAKLATEAAGWQPSIAGLTEKPSGVQFRVGDNSLLRSLTSPPRVTIKAGVQKAISEMGGN